MTVPYSSLAEVKAHAPEAPAGHLTRATELHEAGDVLMAGAFRQPDAQDRHPRTTAICRGREAAERFVAGDPFVRDGTVREQRIRPWANMFAR
jgi:uncharacterized protein YciI